MHGISCNINIMAASLPSSSLETACIIYNSIDYFKCVQHTGQNPETHHTTPSHRDWVTIDYKHTSQSIHSTLGRSAETYPTTPTHRDWIYQYIHTGPLDGNRTHDPRRTISDPDHSTRGEAACIIMSSCPCLGRQQSRARHPAWLPTVQTVPQHSAQ